MAMFEMVNSYFKKMEKVAHQGKVEQKHRFVVLRYCRTGEKFVILTAYVSLDCMAKQ